MDQLKAIHTEKPILNFQFLKIQTCSIEIRQFEFLGHFGLILRIFALPQFFFAVYSSPSARKRYRPFSILLYGWASGMFPTPNQMRAALNMSRKEITHNPSSIDPTWINKWNPQ
jgi:hypothetical protein